MPLGAPKLDKWRPGTGKRRDLYLFGATGSAVSTGNSANLTKASPAGRILSAAFGTFGWTMNAATLSRTTAFTGHDYATAFPGTETSLSESGVWIGGKTVGLDWNDFRTTPGLAFGTQTGSASPPYDDSIACLSGTWGASHTVQATVKSQNQNDNIFEEVELLLRFAITAHNARGYECLFSSRSSGNAYLEIVKWLGPKGVQGVGWQQIAGTQTNAALHDGDVVKATVTGTTNAVITMYINGTQVLNVTDSSSPYLTGAPGIGCYLQNGSGVNGDYGFTSFIATDSAIIAQNASVSAVQTAVNAAVDGSKVVIPFGNVTWASGITTSKQIALVGAKAGGTIITHGAGAGNLLNFTIGSSFNSRIGNLNFLPGSATGNYIQVGGTGKPALLHDIYLELPDFQLQHAVVWNVTGGVWWRVTAVGTGNAIGGGVGSTSGSFVVKSNRAWASAPTMGTDDANGDVNLYIEDCTWLQIGQAPDCDDNARVVIRHCTRDGCSGLNHGTTSTYGGRHIEIYDSDLLFTIANRNENRQFWLRAGTMVCCDCNITQPTGGFNPGGGSSIQAIVENATRAGQWGCAISYPAIGPVALEGGSSTHQCGWGYNGSAFVSDPIYIWNITGTGNGSKLFTMNDQTDDCGNGLTTADFLVQNRDYFVNAGAKPGYTKYQYPHPLRSGI